MGGIPCERLAQTSEIAPGARSELLRRNANHAEVSTNLTGGTPKIPNLQGLDNRLLSSIERRRRSICSGLSPHGPPSRFGGINQLWRFDANRDALCLFWYLIYGGRAPRIVLRSVTRQRFPPKLSDAAYGLLPPARMPRDPNSRPIVGTRHAISRPKPRSRSAVAIKWHTVRNFSRIGQFANTATTYWLTATPSSISRRPIGAPIFWARPNSFSSAKIGRPDFSMAGSPFLK